MTYPGDQILEQRLKKAEKHAHVHWYQDGLAELAVGLYFLLLALLYYVTYFTDNPAIGAFGLPLITIGGVFLLAPLVRRAKRRLTYRRSGYVSYGGQSPGRKLLALALGLATGSILGLLLARSISGDLALDENFQWLPLAQAAVFSLILVFMAYRFGLARYYALAAISLVAGAVFVLAQPAAELGTALIFTVLSIALIVSALVTLTRYLRETEPVIPEE